MILPDGHIGYFTAGTGAGHSAAKWTSEHNDGSPVGVELHDILFSFRYPVRDFCLQFQPDGNCYLECRRNRLNGPLTLRHVPAKYTGRGSDLYTYFIRQWKDEYMFKAGEVCHVMNPDFHQEIYGMPEYIGALLSASLSHSADKFRKLYYDNGSHAGCILYVGAAQVDQESIKVVQKNLSEARGKSAFKNVRINAPGGGKDGV